MKKKKKKKTHIKFNFEDDIISFFNEKILLITTNRGHYVIPITKAKQIINNTETSMQIILPVMDNQGNYCTTLKLHNLPNLVRRKYCG